MSENNFDKPVEIVTQKCHDYLNDSNHQQNFHYIHKDYAQAYQSPAPLEQSVKLLSIDDLVAWAQEIIPENNPAWCFVSACEPDCPPRVELIPDISKQPLTGPAVFTFKVTTEMLLLGWPLCSIQLTQSLLRALVERLGSAVQEEELWVNLARDFKFLGKVRKESATDRGGCFRFIHEVQKETTSIDVPKKLVVKVPIFEDSEPTELSFHVDYAWPDDGKLMFELTCHNITTLVRDVIQDEVSRLRDRLPGNVLVFRGTYT